MAYSAYLELATADFAPLVTLQYPSLLGSYPSASLFGLESSLMRCVGSACNAPAESAIEIEMQCVNF